MIERVQAGDNQLAHGPATSQLPRSSSSGPRPDLPFGVARGSADSHESLLPTGWLEVMVERPVTYLDARFDTDYVCGPEVDA